MLVSQFTMLHQRKGGVFREWTNCVPVDPKDIRLSRIRCDSVVIVVSGFLVATCRRYAKSRATSRGTFTFRGRLKASRFVAQSINLAPRQNRKECAWYGAGNIPLLTCHGDKPSTVSVDSTTARSKACTSSLHVCANPILSQNRF